MFLSGANQIGMEGIISTLTDEQQAMFGTVAIGSVPTSGTGLAGVMDVHFARLPEKKETPLSSCAVTAR